MEPQLNPQPDNVTEIKDPKAEEKDAKLRDLSNKYGAMCARLGELSYQIEILSNERQDLIIQIRNLNQQASKIKKGEEE